MNHLISPQETYNKLKYHSSLEDKNICFVFGAGASYGYTKNPNYYLPPIVKDLFDISNPVVKLVINRTEHQFILGHKDFLKRTLVEEYNDNLEDYLSDLYSRNDEDDTFTHLLLYLHDIYSLASESVAVGDNNYKDLINRMYTLRGKSPWSCISFNYDTILEQSHILAGRNVSRNFENLNHYYGHTNPSFIKMHGGPNFDYYFLGEPSKTKKSPKEVFGLMMKDNMALHNHEINTELAQFKHKQFYQEFSRWNAEKKVREPFDLYRFPLMMIPIHGIQKNGNSFFEEMIIKAKKELESSTLVVAIGYNFGDELFSEEIRKMDLSDKELIIVGTNNLVNDPENHTSFKNISKIWDEDNLYIFDGNGFDVFVRSVINRQPPNSRQ